MSGFAGLILLGALGLWTHQWMRRSPGTKPPEPVPLSTQSASRAIQVHFLEDSSRLLVQFASGSVQVWNLVGSGSIHPLPEDLPTHRRIMSSPSASIVAMLQDGSAEFWDLKSGERLSIIPSREPMGFIGESWWAMDPTELFRAWSPREGQLIRTLELPGLLSVDWRGGRACTLRSSRIRIWDLETGRLIKELPGRTGGLAWGPGNHRVLFLGKDGILELWDIARGLRLKSVALGSSDARILQVYDESGWVLIELLPGRFRLLDLEGNNPPLQVDKLTTLRGLSWARKIPRLAAVDGTKLRFWDALHSSTWQELGNDTPASLQMAPDGSRLAYVGKQGEVVFWNLDPPKVFRIR